MNNNEVITILDGLISTCRRGQEVFRNAAENIQNNEFRRLLNIFSQQRVQFITELKAEVHRLRGDNVAEIQETRDLQDNTVPFKRSSPAKSIVRDEAGIIAECQREEETA